METIVLTPQESEQYFHDALCNAVGTGYMANYGLELEYHDDEYNNARNVLREQGVSDLCYEDVLMQILRDGNTLTLVDIEDDGTKYVITLNDVHTKVQNTPMSHLVDMIYENDDAETADVILQTVFIGGVVYG